VDKVELIKDLYRDEGLRLKPYLCSEGKLTIGVGRNLDDKGISEAEARVFLINDIRDVEVGLTANIPWWAGLSDRRQRVIANMAFQMGVDGLMGFKRMLAALKDGRYEEAAMEMGNSRWFVQTPIRAKRLIEIMRRG
jgi:lysozyme